MVAYPPQGVIPRGVREETASYIIFKEGTTYYAKNGETGQIEFSGTDASTVIQSAINALLDEGRIVIKRGVYEIGSEISGKSNIVIVGEGKSWGGKGTILRWTGASGGTMFNFREKDMYGFRNLLLDGNAKTVGVLVKVGSDVSPPPSRHYISFERVTFIDAQKAIEGGTVEGIEDSYLLGCLFQGNTVGYDMGKSSTQMALYSCGFGGDEERHIIVRDLSNVKCYSCVFAKGYIDIAIDADEVIEELLFAGCWFEGTRESWLKRVKTPAVSKYVDSIAFIECGMGVPDIHDETYPILDLTDTRTSLRIEGGSLYVATGKTARIDTGESRVIISGVRGEEVFLWQGNGKVTVLDRTRAYPFIGDVVKWLNNNWLPSGMMANSVSGSGAIGWWSSALVLVTGSTALSSARVWKVALPPIGWGDRRRYFAVRTRFLDVGDMYLHLVHGGISDLAASANTARHVGFKVVGNVLYGTVADGTAESTLTIETLAAGVGRLLEAVLFPGVEARFWVDGVDKGALTTNLPSGGTDSHLLLNCSIYNTAAVNKRFEVHDVRVVVEGKAW